MAENRVRELKLRTLNKPKRSSYVNSKAFLLVFLFLLVAPAKASETNQKASANGQEQVTLPDMIYVDVIMKLPDSYSLLNDNVMHLESISISANFSTPLTDTTDLSIYIYLVKPSEIVAKAYYQNGTKEIQPYPIYMGRDIILRFYFEAGLKGFNIMIQGYLDGISLLWRNVIDFKGVLLQFSTYVPTLYNIVIQAPKGIEVASINSPDFEITTYIKEDKSEGGKTYTVSFPVRLTIYYRPASWSVLALTLTFLLVFIIGFSPYLINRIHLKIFERINFFISEVLKIIRSRFSSDKIFTSFILCSLLMVSIGLTAGPDPRIKIYAVATPNMASYLETSLGQLGPVQVISPQETSSEFETMANLGIIKAFVILDYPSISLNRIVKYFLESLQRVPLIIIDESSSDPDFSRAVKERYEEKVISIQNINEISQPKIIIELRRFQRQNTLGLNSNFELFKAASTIIALLSFIEAFLGLAFLSSRLIETGRVKGMGSLPEAIAFSTFVFFFTQAIYMVTSVLLNMPIGLHAVSSGSTEITVVGFLGFGGGSSPRAIAGLLGLLAGALAAMKGSEVDRFGFLAFIFLVFLLAIEPFTGGVFFYDSLLFFMSGPRLESINISIYYTKDIFSTIGDIFGGWASDIYGLSTGEIFFYAGAVPIFLFPNLKRSSATMLLLFSCFAAGNGFIRTAEMTPYKTFASFFPGLMMGTFFVITFILVGLLERQLRNKLGK